jgi:hypothetical protein
MAFGEVIRVSECADMLPLPFVGNALAFFPSFREAKTFDGGAREKID